MTRRPRNDLKRMLKKVLKAKSIGYSELNFSLLFAWLEGYHPVDRTKRFLNDVERKINRDHQLFWKLFRYVIASGHASKQFQERFEEAINRYDRLGVEQRERIRMSCNHFSDPPSGRTAEEETLAVFDALPDEITAYRGFILSGGERARAGERDTEEYFKQKAGRGFSFSLDRDRAIWFAANSAYHYGDGLNPLNSDKAKTLTETQKIFDFFYRGGCPCVGEYTIPKEKVLLVIPECGEEEIWVHPDDAHFKRYSPVNSQDVFNKFVLMCPPNYFKIDRNTTYEDMKDFQHKWPDIRPPTKL